MQNQEINDGLLYEQIRQYKEKIVAISIVTIVMIDAILVAFAFIKIVQILALVYFIFFVTEFIYLREDIKCI